MTAHVGATTRQILRIESRRAGAYVVAGLLAVSGTVLVITSQVPLDPDGMWSSSWAGAVRVLSEESIVLGPLAGTAAAWVGGRERRRHLVELLRTTPRSVLSRQRTTWAALTSGVVAGVLLVVGVLTAGIAPAVSYGGGRWPAALLLGVLGLVACAAAGFAAGRLVPGRLVAPAVGLVLYVGNGVLTYLGGSWSRLSPLALVGAVPSYEGTELTWWAAIGAGSWLLALSATAVLVAGARYRAALMPALLAVAVALVLTTTPTDDEPYDSAWLQRDDQAVDQVCTDDVPQVCVQRVHAGLLEDVTPLARDLLAQVATVLPVDRVAEIPFDQDVPAGTLALGSLEGRSRFLRPGLAHPEWVVEDTVSRLTSYRCEGRQIDEINAAGQEPYVTLTIARALLTGGVENAFVEDARTAEATYTRLADDPATAQAWMAQFLPAAANCDVGTLVRLARR